MSIQAIIDLLREVECDLAKAHHLAHYINQYGANMEKTDALETYARNALANTCQAERMAVALRDEAKKEESK